MHGKPKQNSISYAFQDFCMLFMLNILQHVNYMKYKYV